MNGATIDTQHWISEALNADVKLAPSDMGVVMTVAGTAHGPDFLVRLRSLCTLAGDFDVQVDYQLGLWPAASGVRLALATGVGSALAGHAGVERVSLSTHDVIVQTPGTEVYLADFRSFNPFPDIPTTDTQGTIRLTRLGNNETAYFFTAGGGWTTLFSMATTTTEPVTAVLQTWSDDQFFDTQSGGASITFRNYVINSGQFDCPGAADGSSGDAAPSDARTDAAPSDTATSDASATDAGKSPERSSGCGCNLGTANRSAAGAAGLLSLAVLAIVRRRRRRTR
ncbi:MAG TPA: MYXO-CTERM sorting domain-containing protein [Polyangia bacterium]|nr:MYXO-CTERM sorting domain-containing protein [Polyangia bacterium]